MSFKKADFRSFSLGRVLAHPVTITDSDIQNILTVTQVSTSHKRLGFIIQSVIFKTSIFSHCLSFFLALSNFLVFFSNSPVSFFHFHLSLLMVFSRRFFHNKRMPLLRPSSVYLDLKILGLARVTGDPTKVQHSKFEMHLHFVAIFQQMR